MINISQNVSKFKPTPTQIFLIFLVIYTIFALFYNFSLDLTLLISAELAYSLLLNFSLNHLTKKFKGVENTMISTLIFLLILHYVPTTLGIIATIIGLTFLQFYKRFCYYHGNSIFNPVLVGSFFSLLTAHIFQTYFGISELALPFVSWWGASFGGYISLILIFAYLIIEIKQWHKNYILAAFLITYLLASLFLIGLSFTMTSMMSSTIYFFAIIMLVEPRTSPALKRQQILYGLIAALVFTTLRYFAVNNFELLALAVANLFNFILKIKNLPKPRAA